MRQMEVRSEIADELVRVFDLWRGGTLIMDEVDVLLNPLKSELNFPIGERDAIDMSGDRWDLPIHILELVFAASRVANERDPVKRARLAASAAKAAGSSVALDEEEPSAAAKGASTSFRAVSSDRWQEAQRRTGLRAADIVSGMADILLDGWDAYKIKRIPHLVLMDRAFYNEHIRPLAAQWTFLWIQKNAMSDISLLDADVSSRAPRRAQSTARRELNFVCLFYSLFVILLFVRYSFAVDCATPARAALTLSLSLPLCCPLSLLAARPRDCRVPRRDLGPAVGVSARRGPRRIHDEAVKSRRRMDPVVPPALLGEDQQSGVWAPRRRRSADALVDDAAVAEADGSALCREGRGSSPASPRLRVAEAARRALRCRRVLWTRDARLCISLTHPPRVSSSLPRYRLALRSSPTPTSSSDSP